MHLTLHLTTACNMRCSYCYAPPHDGAPMSDEIGRQALDLAARLTSDSCGVVFFGGEPLLCKDRIASLVAYARHLEHNRAGRFHFKITTNGLLLDAAFLEFAVRNDILIAMSLDGVRQAHDQHRRLAGGGPTFDVLVERLKMLLSVRPYSSVLMAVNPDTARYLADSVAFLLDLGCRYLIVSLNYAADWQEADFRVLGKQFKRLGKLYVQWTRAGRKFYLSPFEVKLSSHINQHCWRKERCELAERQLSVDPQGYLFPCVQFPRAGPDSRWCIGHVSRGIDDDARRRIHDESEAEKAFCRECTLKERCHNTCGCLNWQTTGTINGISPVLCRYEQMLTPIADRVGNVLYRKRDPLFLHKHYNAAYPVLSLLEDTLLKK
ncbi:MAG TPA: radical SAM protein [Phycisphaerae bacterium]|nr:radical SAM protein [Phycisphaerae bacterium]HPM24666.1 radical SAM protein [Phycisphaerae bacterium]